MPELLLADPAADRERWLELRRAGVTATDIATILGLVSWDSPWSLYHRKLGHLPEVEASDRMRLGSWLEDAIANEWYSRNLGSVMSKAGMWASNDRPWQLATPDRVLSFPGSDPSVSVEPAVWPMAVLECKTSATKDGWGKCWTERDAECAEEYGKVPAHVRAQMLWQMDVLGVATGHVAVVFLPSGEFRSYTIEHVRCRPGAAAVADGNCDLCRDQAMMRAAGEEFYRRLKGELPPPPLDGSQATLDGLKHLNANRVKGKEVELSPGAFAMYVGACLEYDRAKDLRNRAIARVREAIGDAQFATYEGQRFARRDVYKKAAYEVPAHEEDRLVRIKPKDNSE